MVTCFYRVCAGRRWSDVQDPWSISALNAETRSWTSYSNACLCYVFVVKRFLVQRERFVIVALIIIIIRRRNEIQMKYTSVSYHLLVGHDSYDQDLGHQTTLAWRSVVLVKGQNKFLLLTSLGLQRTKYRMAAEDTSRHYRRITKTASASPVQQNELTIDDALETAIDQFVTLGPVKHLVESVRQSCIRHADQRKRSLAQKRKIPIKPTVAKSVLSSDLPVVSLPFRFTPPTSLSPSGQKAYYSVLEDDTRQMANPHQYLYWASLFDVHPMMAKARSLLNGVTEKAWIQSMAKSGIAGDVVKPARELENYLVLRQLQNEAYAKSA